MFRFFKITPETYESIKNDIDSNEIKKFNFSPSSEAPKDSEGNCLLCCVEEVAAYFSLSAEEISEEQYFAILS